MNQRSYKLAKEDFKFRVYSTQLGKDLELHPEVAMVGTDCIYFRASRHGNVGPHIIWTYCPDEILEKVKRMIEVAFDIDIELTEEGVQND